MSRRYNWNQTAQAMRHGRLLMVTHANDGPSYALDNGIGVSAKVGRDMTAQGDLFEGNAGAMPRGDLCIVPNDDGLFPGMSQTWRVVP
jgi:hypothetical protein